MYNYLNITPLTTSARYHMPYEDSYGNPIVLDTIKIFGIPRLIFVFMVLYVIAVFLIWHRKEIF